MKKWTLACGCKLTKDITMEGVKIETQQCCKFHEAKLHQVENKGKLLAVNKEGKLVELSDLT